MFSGLPVPPSTSIEGFAKLEKYSIAKITLWILYLHRQVRSYVYTLVSHNIFKVSPMFSLFVIKHLLITLSYVQNPHT